MEEVIDLFNKDDRIKSIFVIGKPHFKLLDYDDGHEKIDQIGTKKLKQLILPKNADDSSPHGNIKETLNHILVDNSNLKNNEELLLICGSFFIMTDVRQYFELKDAIDDAAE